MVEPITINVRHLAQDVRLPQEQVQAAIDLLDAGFPIPFIARYRKEVTQSLGEGTLRHIAEELQAARVLCERKQTILKTIESAGKLTPDLDKNIREAKSVKRLEDIYLPFKPKRQNLAAAARDNGLEPFALEIIEGTLPVDKVDERAAEFINEDKKVKSVADVLLGAGHIIADIFSCKAELVHKVREILYQHGHLTTAKIEAVEEKSGGRKSAGATAEEEEAIDTPTEEIVAEEEPTEEIGDTVADSLEDEAAETPAQSEDCGSANASEETDGTEEVTALFEQLKEEQAEKGLPVVRSQNAVKKDKKKKEKAEAKKKLDEIKQRQRDHFERQFTEYFDFSIKLRGIPAHRILAINKGERHKVIHVTFKIDETKVLESVKEICVPEGHIHADFLTGCLQDALHRGVLQTLIREIRNDMTEYAEKNAIKMFGHNLRNLLLQRPFLHKRVLALDTGAKNGCKAVALDEFGNLIGQETVFFAQNAERRASTEQTLADMIRRFNVSAVVIGIGSGSRPAEEAIAHMIETHFADSDLAYIMISKTGAVTYATSPVAKEEFPNEDPFVRTAVSLGRRLQNPLCELVKVEPASLGLNVSQQDNRNKIHKQMLTEIVESCVNAVGVDVNSATTAMLTNIAGLNPMTARRIYEYRREHGAFRIREDLKKVPGINETVYTHAAGFLRVINGENPLDATNIHPESYALTATVLEKLGFSVNDLRSGEKVKAIAEKITAERIGELTVKLSSELSAGLNTVRLILENVSQPGRDIRDSHPPLLFRKTMLKLENLTPGTELTGTILNVTDFGAFVDIGLHESGFIHVSQMASGFIQNAHDKVAAGAMVRLWVVEADAAKKRVSLTLLQPGTERQTQSQRSPDRDRERPPREHSSRPPRPERDRQESPDRPRGDRPPRQFKDTRDGGKRFDRRDSKSSDRAPKTFVTAPIKKEVKPITEKMKQGKEPMRSFGDLAQLFGRVQTDGEEGKKEKK